MRPQGGQGRSAGSLQGWEDKMELSRIWNLVIGAGALLGAADYAAGNRLKLGDKFAEGFLCMGPAALSMTGIICIAPLLGKGCAAAVSPLFRMLGIDPAMFGCILANNMGGYPLAAAMADDPRLGLYSGLILSSMLGATLVYTIPIGLSLIDRRNRDDFAAGIMIGLAAVPAGAVAGGLAMGLSLPVLLRNTAPAALISGLVIAGFRSFRSKTISGFMYFAGFLKSVTALGLGLAAFTHITGLSLADGLEPVGNALKIVTDMCVVQLGSIPLAYLIIRLMRRPFLKAGRWFGINDVAVAAIPISCVNVMSVFVLVKDMDRRGVVLSAAWYTSTISIMTAHYAYTQSIEPEMVGPVTAAKLTGGVIAVMLACFLTRKDQFCEEVKE